MIGSIVVGGTTGMMGSLHADVMFYDEDAEIKTTAPSLSPSTLGVTLPRRSQTENPSR